MAEVRLYGKFLGNGSLAQVTRGFASALRSSAHRVYEFDPQLADIDEEYEAFGPFAPHAFYTADLRSIGTMVRNSRHEHRYVMVAPNSDRIPDRLAAAIRDVATVVLTPSKWGMQVLKDVFPRLELAPHGLDPAFVCDYAQAQFLDASYDRGELRFVHFSTSETDRKGTLALLQAWKAFFQDSDRKASLTLVLDPEAQLGLIRALADEGMELPEGACPTTRVDLGPGKMAKLLQSFHVVVQPSRAEGFGLIPLEARACGVPVIMTNCTGHADHADLPGTFCIDGGPLQSLDEAPHGKAPTVDSLILITALTVMSRSWQSFRKQALENAMNLRAEWSWENQLRDLTTRLE